MSVEANGLRSRLFASLAIGGFDSCWEWQGLRKDGYGYVYLGGGRPPRMGRVHRLMWELLGYGPIPEGRVTDHLCRNRACANPKHLRLVTNRENLLAGETLPAANAAKTHCKHGHSFDAENTHIDTMGKRVCRTCKREEARRRYVPRRANRDASEAPRP